MLIYIKTFKFTQVFNNCLQKIDNFTLLWCKLWLIMQITPYAAYSSDLIWEECSENHAAGH